MTIQYFLPGVADRSHVTREMLKGEGLGDVLSDLMSDSGIAVLRNNVNAVHRGPEGHAGMLVSPPRADGVDHEIGYYPDRQEWHKAGGIWFGVGRDTNPTSLRRNTPLIDGHVVELGDGNAWMAPRIGMPEFDVCHLPQTMGVDSDGEFRVQVVERYADAWRMTEEMMDIFFGRSNETPADSYNYCVRCLALNYRVGLHELSAMKVLTTENYPIVFKAAFDGEMLEDLLKKDNDEVAERLEAEDAAQKKTGSDDSSTPATRISPGSTDSSQDTGPHAENYGSTPRVQAGNHQSTLSATP